MFTEYDNYLFHEGKYCDAYKVLGAHVKIENKKRGVRFTTWAPNAKSVAIVGEFSKWKVKKEFLLKKDKKEDVWTLFIPGINRGTKYKFAIKGENGEYVLKADPYARFSELRPNTASIVMNANNYKWEDREWWRKNKKDHYKKPINIYEVHLGSWRRNGEEFLSYREIAEIMPKYLKDMGYTHVEIMPLTEHPLDKSWGYQGTGFYSPTSRYGTPDELRYLIDKLHREDIGVILDWVPGHFCRDIHGLAKFDGTATYEYQEEWKADNKGWGTLNFDLGRPEVRSFLLSNAIYWIREFHVDGFRVDAVTNMLYLNYGRADGEWVPGVDGSNINTYAVEFIKLLTKTIKEKFPNTILMAEEATTWPKVSYPEEEGGLGFHYKWNMGWMNDSLEYIKLDPIYRKYHHNKMTFSMMYNYNEHFILPLSHDEVVHGKKSMVDKMWGDYWNKFAGLRAFMTYTIGHPGKKLSFMGNEFGQFVEWREYEDLDWHLQEDFPMHVKTKEFTRDLNKFYRDNRALWQLDYEEDGFKWIEPNNGEQSIYIFMRQGNRPKRDTLIFICNFTPIYYEKYNIGVPYKCNYKEIFNTDREEYGGSGQIIEGKIKSIDKPLHNQEYSIEVKVPPMGVLVLQID